MLRLVLLVLGIEFNQSHGTKGSKSDCLCVHTAVDELQRHRDGTSPLICL